MKRIYMQREKILEAFIAETGAFSSEIEQVVEKTGAYEEVWFVRLRRKKEVDNEGEQEEKR